MVVQSNHPVSLSNESTSLESLNCTKYNHLLEEIESMKISHNKRIKTLTNSIKEYKDESDKFKRQFESYRDRYESVMEKNTEMDRRLRQMHMESQRTYVNTTLIHQNTVRWICKACDDLLYFVETSIVQHEWVQTTYIKVIHPIIHIVIVDPYKAYADHHIQRTYQYLRSSFPTFEMLRHSLISIVRDGSRVLLKYLEGPTSLIHPSLDDDRHLLKGNFISKQTHGRRSNHHRHHKKMTNTKYSHISTSRWNRILIQFCISCERNATLYVDYMIQFMFMYILFRGWMWAGRTMFRKYV